SLLAARPPPWVLRLLPEYRPPPIHPPSCRPNPEPRRSQHPPGPSSSLEHQLSRSSPRDLLVAILLEVQGHHHDPPRHGCLPLLVLATEPPHEHHDVPLDIPRCREHAPPRHGVSAQNPHLERPPLRARAARAGGSREQEVARQLPRSCQEGRSQAARPRQQRR
ncbi:hypothetical protein T484DRAFT_1883044, partial [Baffinella frigidus]